MSALPESLPLSAAGTLQERAAEIARTITDRHFARHPATAGRHGDAGRAHCLQDAAHHLAYLGQAVSAEEPALFADYVAWVRSLLGARGVGEGDLASHLQIAREVLRDTIEADAFTRADDCLRAGLAVLGASVDEPQRPAATAAPAVERLADAYLQALLRGERHAASRLVLEAADAGLPLKEIYLGVFQRSQHEIGRLWQLNRISVAQEHYATAATQLVMSQLYPRIFTTARCNRTLVAACVAGDLHEIGVRMVSDLFEIEGWDTFYLGANVPHASVVSTLVERRADVLALSATLTPHVAEVRTLIRTVRATPDCRRVRILVGGHPFNIAPGLWRSVGADGHATDAATAIERAFELTSGSRP
jgi:methanogenic corrinoid protein MtbC1